MQAIFGQVAIILFGGADNSYHVSSNNDHALSYVMRQEQQLALRECSLTTYKKLPGFNQPLYKKLASKTFLVITVKVLGQQLQNPIKVAEQFYSK